jgi:hypothetical protein
MIEIAGALAAFKAVKELGRAVYDAQVDSGTKEKVRDVLERMDAAQATLYELRDELFNVQSENAALKKQISESDEWKAQLARYELTRTPGGAIVYRYLGQPDHYACPNCVSAKRITPLQDNRTRSGKYRCTHPACNGAEFPIQPQQADPPINYSHGGGGGWMAT